MKRSIAVLIVVTVVALALVCLALAGPALSKDSGACSGKRAHREMVQARAEYREAVRVFEATRLYSRTYRPDVGRWVKLARECGWPWTRMPWLMRQMEQESKGQPIPNGSRNGILQCEPYWHDADAQPNAAAFWESKHLPFPWDATSPRQTFRHARVMDPSNWWLVQ